MNAKCNESMLAQRLEVVTQHAEKLVDKAQNLLEQHPEILIECLTELQLALEELRVAEEELCQQNEELQIARAVIEIERQRYLDLFESAPDGYLVTDLYGVVQEANQAAARLLNIDPMYLVGKPIASFVPEEARRGFRSVVNQLPQISRVQEWEVQLQGWRADRFDAALTVEAARCPSDGKAIALRWLVRDITSRKQAEAKIQQLQMQNLHLVEADRLKSQFMATMSHELRTPMNAILGFSDLLLRQFDPGQQRQQRAMLECIFRNGKHLLDMIEEILDFSKLEENHLTLKLEVLDLAQLVQAIAAEMSALAEEKHLKFKVHVAQPNIAIVNDSGRLRQILINLVSNAIKFTDSGSVYLEVHELSREQIVITVSDTGMGIDPVNQAHIFEAFRQLDQSIARRHNGTGLGLSITNALVQLMQGQITVESQIGRGSTFRVELPRRLSLG
ncbi:PAS domain S-box protein [Trichocoleus sp. FACHB-591]|uniref:PAS domain-containing sensor histidine kinase n=1 Tax=Trichocoleus sp. FACHB-591 TaxID=2692872 RepID=UPI0016894807|nr:ATP-binding protein [Trichocoleus sp. FACHB-591]MBD2097309.1 PAS domain S-box protein [Trichocoleus sp. FACHB-591]